jgi:hypothetical protein
VEGLGEIDARELVRSALRMRPDRIVLGEIRGNECIDMLQAMNSGHEGSIGTVHYLSNGHRAFPKERLEAFAGGRVLQLDNFRKLTGFAWPGFTKMNLWKQDKGQKACAAAFVDAIASGGASPIPFEELIEVAEATIAAADLARTSR